MSEEPTEPQEDEELPEGELLPDREMMSVIKTVPQPDVPVSPPTIDPGPVDLEQ
jgi:hypothetical protein